MTTCKHADRFDRLSWLLEASGYTVNSRTMASINDAVPGACWRSEQGEVTISRRGLRVAVLRLTGITDQPAAPIIERTLTQLFAETTQLHTFWDLEQLVNYHSDVRVFSTRVLLAHRAKLASVHTLSTSRIVGMGVSVANLALGGIIQMHKTRDSFDQALSRVASPQSR